MVADWVLLVVKGTSEARGDDRRCGCHRQSPGRTCTTRRTRDTVCEIGIRRLTEYVVCYTLPTPDITVTKTVDEIEYDAYYEWDIEKDVVGRTGGTETTPHA